MSNDFPNEKIFPLNYPTDFNKGNKKAFSESFVSENLNRIEWETYTPLSDTGIDIVAMKDNSTRFIQVKTREASENKNYGFTPKQRDIKTDPRFFFFLYSDHTNDFIIISIFDFLNLVKSSGSSGKSYFESPTFKQGNGKINSFKYKNNKWYYNNTCVDKYVNYNGIKLMEDQTLNTELKSKSAEIAELKYNLLKNITSGNTFKKYQNIIQEVNVSKDMERTKWKEEVQKSRANEKIEIKKLDDYLKDSVKKYWYISPVLMEWFDE